MRRTHGVLAAACAVAGLAMAGCGSSDSGDGRSTGGGDSAPKLVEALPAGRGPVDLVRWALPSGEPTTIDPMKSGSNSELIVVGNLCENLLRLQSDFSAAPGLATRAEWRDRTTFVIDLRPGVRFWDGAAMTADDVVYSMKRNTDPAVQGVNSSSYQRVRSIQRTGPLQVTVTFREPDAQFRNAMAGVAGAVVEKAYAERVGRAFGTAAGGLSCTGPFELVRWSPGEKIDIARNDGYWGEAPQVGTLEFRFLTDTSTLTSALLAGEVDGVFDAPVASASALARSTEGTLYAGPSTASVTFGPTTDQGPAADPKVRAALDLAIDKQAFVRTVLRGYGEPVKTFTPPFAWSGLPGRETYREGYDRLPDNAEDLDEAKRLIAEARPEKKSLVFVTQAGDALLLQTATILQAAARELGFDARIKQLQGTEFSALFYDRSKRQAVDFVITTGYIEVPGALYYAPLFAIPGGLFNWSGYDNPEVTRDLEAARSSIDPEETARLFTQAQAIYGPDRLQVPLGLSYQRLFLNNRLTGATVSMAYISSPWAAELGAS